MSVGRIGVLGAGRMGLPIIRSLIAAGHAVTVFDIDPAALEGAVAAGAATKSTAARLARCADVLVTVLPGVAELEEVMVGDAAALAALQPGSLWLDLTSTDPRVAERIAALAAARDIATVGAPMGGGITAAETRELRFFVGGDSAAVERARPVLLALGGSDAIDRVGESVGDGYTAKLIVNLLWFGQAVAVTEALLLARSRGIDPRALRTSLAGSAASSVFITEYLDSLLDGDYLESFGIDRVVEELDIVVSLARDGSTPFELSRLVARLHGEALDLFGPVEGELLAAKLLEQRAGAALHG